VREVSRLKDNILTCPEAFRVTKDNKTSSDISVLLGCGSVSLDTWYPTFSDSLVVSFSRVKKSRTNLPVLFDP
jgi:hypothetical protein